VLRSILLAIFAGTISVAAVLIAYLVPSTPEAHRSTINRYCFFCHSSSAPRAGVNLRPLDFTNFEGNGETWEKVLRKLRSREMPPPGRWRPDDATYNDLVRYIETERAHLAEVKPNPGRPTLHRLNRAEYANAIHDLLAIDIDVAEALPADDIGYGFDNIGDVLNVSPVLLDRYLAVAAKISRLAVGDPTIPPSYQAYELPHGLQQSDRMNEDMPLGSRGGMLVRHRFAVDAEYEVSVSLQRGRFDAVLGMDRERKLDLRLDGKRLQLFTIKPDPRAGALGSGNDPDAHLSVRLPVKAGTHTLVVTFVKDTLAPEGIPPRQRERAFF